MAKTSSKKQLEANEQRVTKAYNTSCSGVAISIFDMGKVMNVGLTSIAAGDDDEMLQTKIKKFVETIRKN